MTAFNISGSEGSQEGHLKCCAIVWETGCSLVPLGLIFLMASLTVTTYFLIHLFTAFLNKLKYEMFKRRCFHMF